MTKKTHERSCIYLSKIDAENLNKLSTKLGETKSRTWKIALHELYLKYFKNKEATK